MDELPVPQAGESRRAGPGEPVGDAPTARKDRRPTPDQLYLASRLNGEAAFDEYGEKPKHRITPGAIQRWNLVFGVEAVSSAMRTAWGFPPLEGIENPYAYVLGILRG